MNALVVFIAMTVQTIPQGLPAAACSRVAMEWAAVAGADNREKFDKEKQFMEQCVIYPRDRHSRLALKGFDPPAERTISLELSQALLRENEYVLHPSIPYDGRRRLTEEDTEYYFQLITVVAGLKDRNAIKPLAGAITSGGVACEALANFGDEAFPEVAAATKNWNSGSRAAAILTMRIMLEQRTVSNAVRDQIKSLLRLMLTDKQPGVRMGAINAIAVLRDPAFVHVFKRIAKSDPFETSQVGRKRGVYPVRNAATSAIMSITGKR